MDGYLSMKMKRKDLEEVSDEFSDFSLSSPARKIRRLDAELPPIIEEPIDYEQMMPEEEQRRVIPVVEEDGVIILPCSENEERAIVLYKPMNSPSLNSLSSFEVTVNSDLIPSIKDRHGLWSGHRGCLLKNLEDEEERKRNETAGGKGECLAVVPWVASQFPSPVENDLATTGLTTNDPMEAEVDMENADMDIEMDNDVGVVQGQEQPIAMGAGVGFQPWSQQQQHCMTPPQLPQNNSTPIMWSW
ncbi:hypothetical protein MKW94_030165 [Papaver nudicaule]|uniref:Uncharacterized protein n=1 Tax=Papaver nudicaule TaxID=74823 RepID=A0AA41VJR1_PAPNU|nr:hypothetical protein [Papaver nudicaule]